MKIIFLDFDGVLNNRQTSERHRGAIGLDPMLGKRLNMILERTGAMIVVSSTWRSMARIDWMRALKLAGVWTDYVLGKTPVFPGEPRGNEIMAWMEENGGEVEKYAILDDDDDMLAHQLTNFFRTSFDFGLTKEIVEKVITHLGELPTG